MKINILQEDDSENTCAGSYRLFQLAVQATLLKKPGANKNLMKVDSKEMPEFKTLTIA